MANGITVTDTHQRLAPPGAAVMTRARAIFYGLAFETLKGGLSGQLLRLRNPGKYRELRQMRGPRKELTRQRKIAIKIAKDALESASLDPLKTISRVKTIGSIALRADYADATCPSDVAWQLKRDDLIGITVIFGTYGECKAAMGVISNVAEFPRTGDLINPRDFIMDFDRVKSPWQKSAPLSISSTVVFEGVPTRINLQFSTPELYVQSLASKGQYKRMKKATVAASKREA